MTYLLALFTLLKLYPLHHHTMVPWMLLNLAWVEFGSHPSPMCPSPSPLIHLIVVSNNLACGELLSLSLSNNTLSHSNILLAPSPTATWNLPVQLPVMTSWHLLFQLLISLHAAFATTPLLSPGDKKGAPPPLDQLPTFSDSLHYINVISATSLSFTTLPAMLTQW